MGGEVWSSIGYNMYVDEVTQARHREAMAKAEAEFAKLCAEGKIFYRKPTPIRLEDLVYG